MSVFGGFHYWTVSAIGKCRSLVGLPCREMFVLSRCLLYGDFCWEVSVLGRCPPLGGIRCLELSVMRRYLQLRFQCKSHFIDITPISCTMYKMYKLMYKLLKASYHSCFSYDVLLDVKIVPHII